jgi:hypothetical protein
MINVVLEVGGRAIIVVVASVALLACGDAGRKGSARDVSDSGAAQDVIGRPEGSDSIPPEMRGASAGQSTDSVTRFKLPERRPNRKPPVLTRPDSGDTSARRQAMRSR